MPADVVTTSGTLLFDYEMPPFTSGNWAQPEGIELFVSGDQIRKGAATNAVQIAEKLL